MANVGDIVSIEDGSKWVVMGFLGNAHGTHDARLARKDTNALQSPGRIVVKQKDEAGLTVIQEPDFTVGERVTVNDLPGSFQRIEGINAIVLRDAYGQPLKRDVEGPVPVAHPTKIQVDAGESSVSLALLVLENRKF
jgi:hypothetical protein